MSFLDLFSVKKLNKENLENLENLEIDDVSNGHLSIQDYLNHHGLDKESIAVHVVEQNFECESLDDYLSRYGVSENSIESPSDEIAAESDHRRRARSIILAVLAVQMLVIPIWMMTLLTLPVLSKEAEVSQPMQAAYLAAVASDFAGLYYIMTRDLFPQGDKRRGRRRRNKNDKE